jgi:hypothetical protein
VSEVGRQQRLDRWANAIHDGSQVARLLLRGSLEFLECGFHRTASRVPQHGRDGHVHFAAAVSGKDAGPEIAANGLRVALEARARELLGKHGARRNPLPRLRTGDHAHHALVARNPG